MTRYVIHDLRTAQTEIFFDYLNLPAFAREAFDMIARQQCAHVLTGKHLFYHLFS